MFETTSHHLARAGRHHPALLALALTGAALCPTAQGSILTLSYGSSDTSALNCSYYDWNQSSISVLAHQFGTAGQMFGTITTDTPADPTLNLSTSVNNDTGFLWTGYQVTISMAQNFSLSAASVTAPGDWTASIFQPVLSAGQYTGEILYSGGTPVAPNAILDYAFAMSFSGSTQYSFTEKVTPVPEPGSAAFFALTGLSLAAFGVSRRRRQAQTPVSRTPASVQLPSPLTW